MKKVNNSIMLTLFVLFMFINLAIPVKAEINSKLQIDVTTEKEEYTVKDEVKYSIKLDNNYGSDLTDINVKANIPQGMGVISTEGESSNDNITWRIDSIKAGETVELEFIVKVDEEQDDDVIVDVDKPDDDEQDDTEDEDKEINVGISGGNNSSKPNNMPITGGKNSILIIGIGVLLVVGGTLFIKKTKKGKKIICIFVVCTLSGGLVFGNTTTVKAETIDIKIVKAKTVKIGEKDYTVNVEATAKYEADEDELIVKAERFLNTVILKWDFTEGFTYKIERGVNSDSLEIISEESAEKIFTDILNSNEQNAYYRVSAYKEGIEIARSVIIESLGRKDSDNDGLNDEEELRYGTDINNPDTDGDGLYDGQEVHKYSTDPNEIDTDKDNLTDYYEIAYTKTSPINRDTDKNGIDDGIEDFDGDTLNNLMEQELGTNPLEKDSDYDEIDDNIELEIGTNPNSIDSDDDSINDGKELELGFNPLKQDSDDNGVLDPNENIDYVMEANTYEKDENISIKVNLQMTAKSINDISITNMEGTSFYTSEDIPGYLGAPYYINIADENEAILEFEYLNNVQNDNFKLGVYKFDTESLKLVEVSLLERQQYSNNNKVTAKIDSSGEYILLNKVTWEEYFNTVIIEPGTIMLEGLDLAICIDESGSMMNNDPSNLRINLVRNFIESIREKDRISVIEFGDYATILQGLTDDKEKLEDSLKYLGSNNEWTNIHRAIKVANEELINNGDIDKNRYIILLTDGVYTQGWNEDVIKTAQSNNIKLFTIGLGNGVDDEFLTRIAEETGGKYYFAEKISDLDDVTGEIGGNVTDITTDTDGDGISDYHEENFKLPNNQIIKLDKYSKDTDGDGIEDGEEAGIYNSEMGYWDIISNPKKIDSDYDGHNDKYDDRPLVWEPTKGGDFYYGDNYLMHAAGLSYYKTDEVVDKKISEVSFGDEDKDISLLSDWTIIASNDSYDSDNDNSKSDYGFGGVAVKKGDIVIIAFEGSGTDDFVYDWVLTDGGAVVEGLPSIQLLEAYKFTMKVISKIGNESRVYITGHSLGGWLANKVTGVLLNPSINNITRQIPTNDINSAIAYVRLAADKLNSNDMFEKNVTFAAPGFTEDTLISVDRTIALDKIYGYKYNRDPVSKFGSETKNYGKTRWSKSGVYVTSHFLSNYYEDWSTVFYSGDSSKYEQYPECY